MTDCMAGRKVYGVSGDRYTTLRRYSTVDLSVIVRLVGFESESVLYCS